MNNEATPAVPNEDISVKQQLAIDILLVGGTDQQAADAAGVARSTVNGWRNHEAAFKAALRQARADLLKRSVARLHAATTVAVRALEEVCKDTANPGARVSAARAIVELSHKAVERDE